MKRMISSLINVFILFIIWTISFFLWLYFLQEEWIVSNYFDDIKNFIVNYNIFLIKERYVKVIAPSGDEFTLGISNNTWVNMLSWYANSIKNIANIRYINIPWGKQFPIIDVVRYSLNFNKDTHQVLDELIKFGVIIKYKNIILTHSSGRWVIWKYWILNYKVWSTVTFEDMLGNKIKYKVDKIYHIPAEQYKKGFKFYKNKLYMITCYPIWSDKNRWIAVLSPNEKNEENK